MRKLRLIEKKIINVLGGGCMKEDELYIRCFGDFMGYSKSDFKKLLKGMEDVGLTVEESDGGMNNMCILEK